MLTRISTPRLLLAVLAAVLVVAVAAIAGQAIVSPSSPSPSSSAPSPSPSPSPIAPPAGPARASADPPGYTRFSDEDTGFSIAYPATWARVPTSDPEVKLLVAQSKTTSLLVRVAPVGLQVTRDTLPVVRGLTDKLVRAAPGVQLTGEPQPLVFDGLPGYRYDYTFDSSGGASAAGATKPKRDVGADRGAHVHYFLFKRGLMITLVFQALPAARLEQSSPLFERIAATFRGRVG